MKELKHFLNQKPSKDTSSNNMAKFFHGTHKPAARMIEREGLKPVNDLPPEFQKMSKMSTQTDPSKTYFFKDKSDAAVWSDVISKTTGFPPAIVQVDVPKKQVTRDLNMPYGESYSYPGRIHPSKVKVLRDEESKDKLTLLNIKGTDKYRLTRLLKTGRPSYARSSEATGTLDEWKETGRDTGEEVEIYEDKKSKNDLTYLLALPIVHQPSLISSAYGYAKTRLNLMHKPLINPRRDKASTNMAWEKGLDAEDIPLAKGRWQKGERTYTKKRVLMDPNEFLQRQYEQRPGKRSTYDEWVRSVSDTRIEKLKQAILDPKQKVPVPIEEYNRQGKRIDLQEGRHRGLAAQELGVQVPVILARQKAAPWDRINQDDHYTHKYEFDGEVPPQNNDWERTIKRFSPDKDEESHDKVSYPYWMSKEDRLKQYNKTIEKQKQLDKKNEENRKQREQLPTQILSYPRNTDFEERRERINERAKLLAREKAEVRKMKEIEQKDPAVIEELRRKIMNDFFEGDKEAEQKYLISDKESHDKAITLYHGTGKENLESIKAKGLRGRFYSGNKLVYVTSDHGRAEHFGKFTSKEPVLLKVKGDDSNLVFANQDGKILEEVRVQDIPDAMREEGEAKYLAFRGDIPRENITQLNKTEQTRRVENINKKWQDHETLIEQKTTRGLRLLERDQESHDKKWKYDYTMGWEKPAIRTKLKLVNPHDLEFQESPEDKDRWKIENIKDSGEIREPVEAWNKYGPTQKLQLKDGHHRTIAAQERGDKLIPVLIYDKQLDRDYHRKRNKLPPYNNSEEE